MSFGLNLGSGKLNVKSGLSKQSRHTAPPQLSLSCSDRNNYTVLMAVGSKVHIKTLTVVP